LALSHSAFNLLHSWQSIFVMLSRGEGLIIANRPPDNVS